MRARWVFQLSLIEVVCQDLLGLDDSAGAKSIILSNRDQVAEFPFPEGEIDIDTAEDRERFCSSNKENKGRL